MFVETRPMFVEARAMFVETRGGPVAEATGFGDTTSRVS
jgi:hypothetical protein